MKTGWKYFWVFLGGFLAVVLLALPLVIGVFGGRFGWMPMMGRGYYGMPHMFGGVGFFGGGLMMLGMFLIPLLLLVFLVLGGVALFKGLVGTSQPPAAAAPCAHCGKPLQAGWSHCPHCGEKI
jgi:hypothetical protein